MAPAIKAGEEAVLKISWPHYEAEHELEGLQLWSGDGIVPPGEQLRTQGWRRQSAGPRFPNWPYLAGVARVLASSV